MDGPNGEGYRPSEGRLYVLAQKLLILDIAKPAEPIAIGEFDPVSAISISISGTRAWIAGFLEDLQGEFGGSVNVYNVSDPANIRWESSYKLNTFNLSLRQFIRSVVAVNDRGYVAADLGGLRVLQLGLPGPTISATPGPGPSFVRLSWPRGASEYRLQERAHLGAYSEWQWANPVTEPQLVGNEFILNVLATTPSFFRLAKP